MRIALGFCAAQRVHVLSNTTHQPEHTMSKTLTPSDVVEELTQIKEQMLDLIENVRGILKAGGFGSALARAEDYWMAHLTCAISHDHGYLGRSGCTLQDTIEEIESGEDEEDDHA
ncbi:hypothetical protein C2I38_01185 [Ralstonia solanacearum]|uniref:Uncharacterized protein n=2 Tax=Ralstonia solanacearum TaxID=305 RepID=A0A809E931_RALSL|nr:hypothetical protein C2I38_01185 [Ralstonia solanacearum]AYB56736.1 hypothetical protein C2L97_12295 [Ralstonia solanacearum]OAI58587.1 hypothetical protein RSP597_25175 [Ralstonia solanacearum]